MKSSKEVNIYSTIIQACPYKSIILNRVHNYNYVPFVHFLCSSCTSNILEVGIVVKGVQVDKSSIKQILVVVL